MNVGASGSPIVPSLAMGTASDLPPTTGCQASRLVKGVNTRLPAEVFSAKPAGLVNRLSVGGDTVTHGAFRAYAGWLAVRRAALPALMEEAARARAPRV